MGPAPPARAAQLSVPAQGLSVPLKRRRAVVSARVIMDAAADASMALTSEASPSASSADDEREDATLEDEVDQYAAALGEARQENAALKANFESLREMHVALSEKCRALELNGSRSEADKRQKDVQLRNLQQLLEQVRNQRARPAIARGQRPAPT